MSTTLPMLYRQSKEFPARNNRGSDLLRAQRIRDNAARLNRMTLTRPAKQYGPLLSPQKVSGARQTGGAVAEVGLQMLADPHNALVIAEHLSALARSLTQSIAEPLVVVLLRESKADAAEDMTQDEVLADPANLEKLRGHRDALRKALAEGQRALDVIERDIAEAERGES